MSNDNSLELIEISKRYGTVNAVSNVSLTVNRGDFLTLLGPSGSGKTTVLMSIAGFVALTSGRIRLNGQPIDHLPPERRNFGMVFQGYALFPHLTVANNVAFSLQVRHRPRSEVEERVNRTLDLVQLSEMRDRLPRELSGGQQQRVALARALAFTPDLLLLDEPLSALDKKLRTELQVELRRLHQRLGLTFICVTHDQEEAMSMSDRVAILRDGRLIQMGSPRELYERPRTKFVADFLGGSNFLRGQVEAGDGQAFAYRVGEDRFVQQGSGIRPAAGAAVMIALRPERIKLTPDWPGGNVNAVQGRIDRAIFNGSNFHIVLTANGVGDLAVVVPAWGIAFEPSAGASVWASWEPHASAILADD
ncbi:MAG: ABC transporter ATP-binding protein [Casimicrobiaceae bacterium]